MASMLARCISFVLPLTLVACLRQGQNGVPAGADPEKVSKAEFDLAQDEWKHGRVRAAMDHAQKASSADDAHAEAHHFVSILYMALCQVESDCRWDEAEKYARKAVAADAEYRPAKHTLGVILIQQKKYDEAIAILRPLAEDIIYKTPELAWYDLGGAHLEKGDADHAIEALTKAIALKPSFCWANYRLGLAWEKKGAFDKAEDELSNALEPADPACRNLQDAYEARGRVREKTGRKGLAKQDYELCAKLSTENATGKSCVAGWKRLP